MVIKWLRIFPQKCSFFWGSKTCTSYLSTCSSSRCILIPVSIWYVQNMRPVQECNLPAIKGWSYHTISWHVFEESWWQAWWFMFGFALVKHCPCDGSYVTELSVCTFVVQGPFPSPPCQIPPSSSWFWLLQHRPLWCITYVQNSDIQNLSICELKKVIEITCDLW
jgi:hypothetical protein